MKFTRNENNQRIHETPEGESNVKEVLSGFWCQVNNHNKIDPAGKMEFFSSRVQVNSNDPDKEVGDPVGAGRKSIPLAVFLQWCGKSEVDVAAFFCDVQEGKYDPEPVEGL